MKKAIFALAALALALCLPPTGLAAAGDGGTTDNFVRSKTYEGQFSDLEGNALYDNIAALYEYGLSVGKGDGTFGSTDPVTVGQAVIFAGRIRSLYATGDPEEGSAALRTAGGAAYEPYLRYLQSMRALGDELDGVYADAASRSTVAHILANALPEEALPSPNAELIDAAWATGKFIPDVGEDTPYYEDILALYRRGILQGSGAFGNFSPGESVSRGALAAMLTRIMDPALRVTPDWDLSAAYSAAGTAWGDLVSGAAYTEAPSTQAEVEAAVAHMLSRESSTLTLRYPEITAVRARQIMNQALRAVKTHCEQSYNTVECVYDTAGSMTLTFGAVDCSPERLESYRAYTLEAAVSVHDRLWETGVLTPDMSEYDRARVYFDWICQNCVYDAGAGESSLSHIPYALFHNGVAVCDGYTGAYNLLLKLEGIDCAALSNSSHIWTVAELDGTEYHIDATWGDSLGGGTDFSYFGMTAEQSWSEHPW